MAKTNFSYEKRQRELEKKKKAEEKARKKLEAKNSKGSDATDNELQSNTNASHDEQPV